MSTSSDFKAWLTSSIFFWKSDLPTGLFLLFDSADCKDLDVDVFDVDVHPQYLSPPRCGVFCRLFIIVPHFNFGGSPSKTNMGFSPTLCKHLTLKKRFLRYGFEQESLS